MTYDLEFKVSALKEWNQLDKSIKELFKKRLAERIITPRMNLHNLVYGKAKERL
jgi:mRNA interferase RelE/StbE